MTVVVIKGCDLQRAFRGQLYEQEQDMGAVRALDMAQAVSDGRTSLRTAVSWHVRTNHYPALPSTVVPVALAAIHFAGIGCWDTRLVLPDGMRYKLLPTATVRDLVDEWHLSAFIQEEEE